MITRRSLKPKPKGDLEYPEIYHKINSIRHLRLILRTVHNLGDSESKIGIGVFKYKFGNLKNWEFVLEINGADSYETYWIPTGAGPKYNRYNLDKILEEELSKEIQEDVIFNIDILQKSIVKK